MAMACVFCRILRGEAAGTFVHRGRSCVAFMDIQPVNAGHVLIVPTRHVADFGGLADAEGAELMRLARQVAVALRGSGLRCEGVNLLLADGEAAGQEVFHVHLHVIPRFAGDGFGFRFGPTYARPPSRAELEHTAERIRAALDPWDGVG
jgi:histidine triad (HIT) family protein